MTAAGAGTGRGDDRAGGESAPAASIGSVLDALRADFPEITISKIRFLESEGLISPARTPSGYRQFAPDDVARLRFVLSAQRDHYLPLKVIRAKLEEFDLAPTPGGPTLVAEPAVLAPVVAASPSAPPAPPAALTTRPVRSTDHGGPRDPGPRDPDLRDPVGRRSAGPVPAPPRDPAPPHDPAAPGLPADDDTRPDRAELLAVDGVDETLLAGLEAHGLLRADPAGTFEPEARGVAATAAALAVLGVEPRLLRGLRAGAEREAGLLVQLVTPVARGRSTEAGERAAALSRDLATLSGRLHTLLVAGGLREARR